MPMWTKEQTEAIEKEGENIIVSAGAGSGKTAVLTERVITKLKKGLSLDNLLILTFTNAAALEMKQRIRDKIIKENLTKELPKIDAAEITTFDAYALSLVKKYSHKLNLSKNISIIDQSILNLERKHIIEEIFEEYYKKNTPLFIKMLNDFTLKDDSKIINNILNVNKALDNLYNKEEYLNNYLNQSYSKENIEKYLKDYQNLLKETQIAIQNTIENLSFYVEGNYIEKLNTTLNNLIKADNYDQIKISIPSRLPNLPKNTQEEAKNIKKELSENLKTLKELTKYPNEEYIKQTIYQTKDYAQIIIEIIKKLDQKLNKIKKEKSAYEFIDIARLAITLLHQNKDITEELKNKYQEILIDEYQDTNDTQEKFISYIEKNNVYMVGDIKQSIYRFRNTNPKLFKQKYENYTLQKGGYKIDLNKNFRSRSEVLNSINLIFNQIMDANIGQADYIKSHQMIFGNETYNNVNKENYNMEILNYKLDQNTYSKAEIEIFSVAKDIQEKITTNYQIMDKKGNPKNIEYKDFAILIDRSSDFELYKKIFEYLNIPITIYKDKAITASDEIIILKHIYNLILSKSKDENFKYSFVSLARSYLFNLNDNDIIKIIKENLYNETEIYQKCQTLKQNLEEKTNQNLIEEIIHTFDIYQKMITIGDIKQRITVIDAIIKIAKNCDQMGYNTKSFYDYLNEVLKDGLDITLSLNKEDANSVKIMTIHTSKGLEFPICYFTGLSKKFNLDDLKNLFYFSKDYGIITPYMENSPKTTILKTLLKHSYIKEEISERIRLFYVALTRAREKIIIVTSLEESLQIKENGLVASSVRLKYTSFQSILSSVYKSLEKYIKNIQPLALTKEYNIPKKLNLDLNFSNNFITLDELNIKSEEIKKSHFSKETHKLLTKEEKKNINLGLKMHKILENIDFKHPNLDSLKPLEKKKIKAFLNQDILKNVKETYKEFEFIYMENNEEFYGIIDLLLIKENENIIVDYKLKNTEDKEYLNQLKGYKKYIENKTNKPAKIYLYSILDETLKEI